MTTRTRKTSGLRGRPMLQIKLLATGVITTLMIFGASLVFASQPGDDGSRSGGPAIGGGLGHALKK